MEFVVCVKQVPDSNKVDINPETGSLIRESAGAKVNPYDLSAIEASLQIREKIGGRVHAVSMGPIQAKFALRSSLALGVDSAWLVSDKCFAGSDVLTTSYTLAQSIAKITKPDIIFCGKQSTDGDTSQVGPELAEILGIPHACYVKKIDIVTEKYIIVTCDMDKYEEVVKLYYPCLISVEKDSFVPRMSTYRDKIVAQKKPINIIQLKDLQDKNEEHYGYKGSPTKVNKLYVPKIIRETEIIDGKIEEVADKLWDKICEWGGL